MKVKQKYKYKSWQRPSNKCNNCETSTSLQQNNIQFYAASVAIL